MKKFMFVLMSILLVFSSVIVTGCRDGGVKIDKTKTQLYIGLEKSGFGRDWMDSIITDFESTYAETQFEPGTDKKGVQVIMRVEPDAFSSSSIKNNIEYFDEDIYFINMLEYADFTSRLNGGSSNLLADLTDTIKAGDENSIYNRMHDEAKEYFNVGTEQNPKFFAVPFVSTYWGLVYDKDLFTDKGLYNIQGYTGLDGVAGTADDFWGPNGVQDDTDDGLPATWEDFKLLIDLMVMKKVTPFTWTGSVTDYRVKFLNTIIASYEGVDNFKMRYNWNGEFNGETITKSNAYKLAEQEGVKAMLTFAEHITSNAQYYSTQAFSSQTHTEAQDEFLSKGNLDKSYQPIGFLLEASWWEHEAKSTISRRERANFGFLPFPKFIGTEGVEDQVNTKTVISGSVGTTSGAAFISKNSKHMDVAKKFLQFFFEERNSSKFTEMTGLLQPYSYEIKNLDGLTTYAKDLYNFSQSEYVDMINFSISNPDYVNYKENFEGWDFKNVDKQSDALKAFADKKNYTINDFWKIYKDMFTADKWSKFVNN